jgi:hypothetical protein
MAEKSWVIKYLSVNHQEVNVVDGETNSKLKVDVIVDAQTLRVFFPGSILFSDKDHEESKGSRLATDMDMRKIPDRVLYSLDLLTEDTIRVEKQQDNKTLFLQNNNNDNLTMILELASKWSLNDLYQTIQKVQKSHDAS